MNILRFLFFNWNSGFLRVRYVMTFIMAWLTAFSPLSAQQVKIDLTPKEILIGQQASLQIQVEVPAGSILIWPAVSDTIGTNIEIVRFGRPDTISGNEQSYILQQTHLITAWEEGFFPVPPLTFFLINQNDSVKFESEASLLEVKSVATDPDAGIKDIKTILGVPVSFRELAPYIAGLLLIMAIIWLAIWYFRNRKKPAPKPTLWEKPDIPAHVAAISALENLKNKKLWQAGKLKLYHSELTEILRMYLDKRYKVHAMEMTSGEIMQAAESNVKDEILRNNLRQILEIADLVKFARYKPGDSLNQASLDLAFEFVTGTKIVEQDVG